jgi:hypothetical protein
MTSQFVYLLSTYDEHGSEEVQATLDRSTVRAMLRVGFPYTGEHESASLAEAMSEQDSALAERSPVNLSDGWGGIQLHVVRIDAWHQ